MLKKVYLSLLALSLLCIVASKSVKALDCLLWFPNYTGDGSLVCVWWQPILIDGARWCSQGEEPAANEVFLYVSQNYYSGYYCQAIPVASYWVGGTNNYRLYTYGLDGPSFSVWSIKFGTNAMGYVYSEDSLGGTSTYFSHGSSSADTGSLSISSFNFYTFPRLRF